MCDMASFGAATRFCMSACHTEQSYNDHRTAITFAIPLSSLKFIVRCAAYDGQAAMLFAGMIHGSHRRPRG